MSVAVPETPLTVSGGVAWSSWFAPQQKALPVPAWIAQLWLKPEEMSVAITGPPLTVSGGVA
jgi:hypothetical protein